MSSFATESKDPHRAPPALSLSVESAPSSSPFPSPSSSFIPPPIPGAHEFAVKPAPLGRRKASNATLRKEDISAKEPTATITIPEMLTSPTTPTPTMSFTQGLTAKGAPPPSITTTGVDALYTPTTGPTTPSTPHNRNSARDSLTSTRPAPPSPAVSRRASAALSSGSGSAPPAMSRSASTRSRGGSRPSSTSLSRTPSMARKSNQRHSLLSQSHVPEPAPFPTVLVRDFGFPDGDERREGMGLDVPRPNRLRALNRLSSASSDGLEVEDEDDEEHGDDWGGFKWGFQQRFSSWGEGKAQESAPSTNDFARNFDAGEDEEESDGGEFHDAQDEEEEDEPLWPGLYRAMYAFQPEGTAEMALEEDQIVRVVGRGGGVGWAVVVKPVGDEEDANTPPDSGLSGSSSKGSVHALVPESYLELVELDEEPEEETTPST